MATKAIIRCKKCGEEFPIYWNDVTHEPIKCKHCGLSMNEFMTEQVINAFAAVVDANKELYKSHIENHEPLFEIEFSHKHFIDCDFPKSDD